jgi:CubicO group peptidase (beta-lactamase class C family)
MKNLCPAIIFILVNVSLYGQIEEKWAVDSIFAEWDKPDVPGCALGIVKNGELIYARGYGIGDLEHDIAILPSSVFYLGSVSKQFVTFSVLLLEEQGKLNLDDEIQKFLPDFPEHESPLTIRHFIHHTSGVRDYFTLMNLMGRNYLDHIENNEVYELIKRQSALNFSPGDQYMYSNSCYFMLAMIIEKAAGQTLKEFAAENIFEPLGMSRTLFYDDNTDIIKNRVFSYAKEAKKDKFDNLIMRFDLVGSGGVYSCVEDLFLWDQNFYHNKLGKGGQDIIHKMHEEGLLNNGESSGYAFALNIGKYHGLRTVSHGGSLAGYRSVLLRFPEQQFSAIILANRSDANPEEKAFQIADIFLRDDFIEEDRVEEMEPEASKSEREHAGVDLNLSGINFKEYTGNYCCKELNTTYELFIEDEVLKVKIGSFEPMALNAYDEDRFTVEGEGLLFRFTRVDRKIAGFDLDAGSVKNLIFHKEQKK